MSELKIIKGEASEIEEQAARQIKDIVRAKPDAAIALAAGRDVKGLYKRLGEMCAAGEVSLKNGGANWYDSYVSYAVTNGIIERTTRITPRRR